MIFWGGFLRRKDAAEERDVSYSCLMVFDIFIFLEDALQILTSNGFTCIITGHLAAVALKMQVASRLNFRHGARA